MRSGRTPLALVAYGAMAAIALGWGALAGRLDLYHHPAPWLTIPAPWATVASLAAGLALAGATVAATRWLVVRASWARDLHREMRAVLAPLTPTEIAAFAIGSGLGEELFFRGAMQPALGWVATSILFGAVHLGPRRMWTWTLWAALMGFALGAVHEATGELIGPVVAHVLVNYLNLRLIDRYDPDRDLEGPAQKGS